MSRRGARVSEATSEGEGRNDDLDWFILCQLHPLPGTHLTAPIK